MATLQKMVGLRWLLLGVFPFGVTLRRVEGSHAVWVRSNVEPVEWSDGNRVISSITPDNIAAGQIWVRGTDGVSTLEYGSNEPPVSVTSPTEQYFTTEYILDSDTVQSKQIALIPKPKGRVRLNVLYGIEQAQDIDFNVNGDGVLSWDSLALELLVSEGSKLYISYFIGT